MEGTSTKRGVHSDEDSDISVANEDVPSDIESADESEVAENSQEDDDSQDEGEVREERGELNQNSVQNSNDDELPYDKDSDDSDEEEPGSQSEGIADEDEAADSDSDNAMADEEKLLRSQQLRNQFGSSDSVEAIKTLFSLRFAGNSSSVGKHYLLSGGSLEELIAQLQYIDTTRKSQTIVIFQAIQITIIRIQQEKLMDAGELTELCKQFVTNYIVEVLSHLRTRSLISHQKTALRLLSALATVDDSVALQLLSSVDFSRDLLKMLTVHVDPSQTTSLRVLYIHFLMALIIGHSPAVIRKLGNKPFWLSSIFLGLKYDLLNTVGLVLKTLDDFVIQNMAVPKTTKLFVFNSKALVNLAELYNWDPASFLENSRHIDNRLKIKPTEPEERDSVRELVHGVLLNLVTSTKYGIIFNDPSFGTTNLVANSTANHFMKDCGQPWEDPLKQKLISKMLSTCPDLMKSFYNMISHEQGPHPTKWSKVAAFLTQTISQIDIKPESFSTIHKACIISIQIFLPHVILDNVAASWTDFKRRSVAAHTELLSACLTKIKGIAKILEKHYPNTLNPYIARITAHLCSSSITADKMLKAMKELHCNNDVSGIRALCDVTFLLNDLVPQTLDPVKFNNSYVGKLQEIIDDVENDKEKNVLLKINLLKLQLLLDPQIAKRDGAVHLNEICGLSVPSSPENVRSLGLSMIKDILFCTGFFLGNAWELDLWMTCIESHVQPSFGKKLAAAISYAEQHKFELSNVMLRSYYQTNTVDPAEFDSKLDDFLDMEIDDIDEFDAPTEKLRLSPLLPGFLKANEKMGNVTKAFVVHCAHMVHSEGFHSLIKETLGKDHVIVDYLAALARRECISLDFSPFSGTPFMEISDYILNEESSVDCESIHSNVKKMGLTNLELAVSEVLRFALSSQNNPQRFDRCCQLLTKFCSASDDGSSAFQAEKMLAYSGLLDEFHPILVSSTPLVSRLIRILGIAVSDKNHPNLNPFSVRFAGELQWAAMKRYRLENVDKDDMLGLLQLVSLNKHYVTGLGGKLFLLSNKYFISKGQKSLWADAFEYVLSWSLEKDVVWSEEILLGAISKVTLLVRHPEVTRAPDLLHSYLKKCDVGFSSLLLDGCTELLRNLCLADHWYEPLAQHLITKVHLWFEFPLDMEFQREVTLLAAIPRPRRIILYHRCKCAVKSLSSDQKFLEHLADIGSDAFIDASWSKMAMKVVKNSSDVYPSTNALKFLEAVFKKADRAVDLLNLALAWLDIHKSQNSELCPGIATTLENIAKNIDSSLLPAINSDIMEFFVEEGINRQCKSMIEVLRLYLLSDRLRIDPRDFFQKLTAHPQFDNALMNSDETFKCSFISLLSILIEKDGSLVNGERLPGFLSTYHATLGHSDQLLLKILQQHEITGVNLGGRRPLLWGNAALAHYSVKKKPSLSQSHPYQTLNALNPSIVSNTIANFPIHRDVQGLVDGDSQVYDPAFILPILCNVALPGHKVKSRTFFQSGAVALALASLSSSSSNIRRIATLFLQRLHENHIGLDKIVWSNFIETVRHGIAALSKTGKSSKKNLTSDDVPRISSITATFLARASIISGDPSAPLYRPLHHFILARPAMNLSGVPAFLELIHSTDVKNHERHREWILEVIRDGMREPRDLQIVLNSYTLKIILAFYSSSLAKPHTKKIIEDIIEKCLLVDMENHQLIHKCGLLPWVLAVDKPPLTAALPKLSPFSQHAPLLSLAAR